MKKNIFYKLYFLYIISFNLLSYAQENSLISSVTRPAANQTGVPNVSFPLVNLKASNEINLSLALYYDPNSYKPTVNNGKIARNWNLNGANFTITRDLVNGSSDEEDIRYGHEPDDIYYYSIFGEQGSFMFKKTGDFPNDLTLVKLTPSNVDIQYERTQVSSNQYDRPINYFIIKDGKGIKYYFTDYDEAKKNIHKIRNTFYITKITDASDNDIVTFINKKYYSYSSSNTITEIVVLPENIVTSYGKIEFVHQDFGTQFNLSDRYSIKEILLKNQYMGLIFKYVLPINQTSFPYFDPTQFSTMSVISIRTKTLKELKKYDSKNTLIEKVNFNYNYRIPPDPTWDTFIPKNTYSVETFYTSNLLNSVVYSNGLKVNYYFAKHTKKRDEPLTATYGTVQSPNTAEIEPFSYKVKVDSISFDSKITKKYYLNNLQKGPNTRIYVKFFKEQVYPWDTGIHPTEKGGIPPPDPELSYKMFNYNSSGNGIRNIQDLYSKYFVVPSNGTAYLEITGSGGTGWFEVYEKQWSNPPYIDNNLTTTSDTGVRIDKIEYYNKKNVSQYTSIYELAQTINYDYNLSNNPNASSGVSVFENNDPTTETILYKNVKIVESDKKGYVRYQYRNPDDFPSYTHPTKPYQKVKPHFDFTKKGVLSKIEIFNENNQLIALDSTQYIFPPFTEANLSENRYPEKINTYSILFDENSNQSSKNQERKFNLNNNNLMYDKAILPDGNILETEYKYSEEKPNNRLLNAGVLSVPLEVTRKQNGVEINKIETFYEHPDNLFPSSLKTFGINGTLLREEKNEIYDTLGNVIQYSSKDGIPTTFIYGYNSTLLIAKIEGLKYSEVMTAMGESNTIDGYKNLEIYTQSNLDVDDVSEETLRQKLDAFRLKTAFKNYHITTYTYDPLIGIKSVTSPSGNKEYYYYDNANRMIRIEDTNHNVIKENKYKQNLLN